ncbi:hypothetical protein SAMN05660493_02026 [Epilithonimonas bovis DSM 19482]|uniref:Outer membrane protein beta-barrel domain-containing protein n=1 Tax=Epilithonimonas bovis DSM 19482 TaxID=1121284 RepID=A0A1U7PZF5_9FLAO|nr:hypothetical protein [Epilithonimonas bovis]MDN5626909.1 hypothetical protein [Weeksellaceae bacterium]QIY82266.1 hypothetical protein HER18_01245 [Chryseobacterium sp. NEB161]SIT97310.1 hypothetical protein SAMN05660493_02026 [Epilithonimonas bovis DSM 19482]
MKHFLLFMTLIGITNTFAQETAKSKTMGFYISPNVQVGYNLGNSIKDSQHKNDAYYQQYVSPYLPNDFTYGLGVVGGYHILPFFALGTGLRYNFIANNQHLLNWVVQPKFFFGNNDDKGFLELEYGTQINHSNVNNTNFYGLKIGYLESFSKRLNSDISFFIYSQNYDKSGAVFIGVSFGATIFTNKNYTVYGKD